MMHSVLRLTLYLLLTFSASLMADIAIIVHPDNSNNINEDQLRNLYMGKTKVFPNGMKAQAFALITKHPSRDTFNKAVLHKSESNLNSYWARMIFSSRAKPPLEVNDEQSMIHVVSQNKNGIGYIDANMLNNQVRVILRIKD